MRSLESKFEGAGQSLEPESRAPRITFRNAINRFCIPEQISIIVFK